MPSLRDQTTSIACLPLLSAGSHRGPRDGACFMEMASLLAGERWSDHPRCTHPVLCVLARAVNDACSDAGRQKLAPHVPDFIGRNDANPRITAALYRYCAEAGLRRRPGDPRLTMARKAAVERLGILRRTGRLRRVWHAALEPDFRTAAGMTAADAAFLTAHAGDAALHELLLGALAVYEAAADRGAQPNRVVATATTEPSAPTDYGTNHG